MLLPSALSCDSSQPPTTPQTRRRPGTITTTSALASPPTSPRAGALGSIFNTCRSLQSLIATPQATAAPTSQLPTPPMSHAVPPPPLKLRLRSRSKPDGEHHHHHLAPRKKVVKRAPPPPRGANKRRRPAGDDMGRDDVVDQEGEEHDDEEVSDLEISEDSRRPSTPKRARIAPEVVPLGLGRSDYHDLHLQECCAPIEEEVEGQESEPPTGASNPGNPPPSLLPPPQQSQFEVDEWSTEDDRILVELVLEKLKLSKTEWQDCARSLGKDRHSVGRRWKSLVSSGDVGLKTRSSSRRAKLHSTWR